MMKYIGLPKFQSGTMLLFIIFISSVICCKGQQSDSVVDNLAAKITFEHDTINCGTIAYNSNPYRAIKFSNTGKEPLLIEQVVGDVVRPTNYPKEPIMPGQSSEIDVICPTNRIGFFVNFIAVTTNLNPPQRIIIFKGTVLAEDGDSSKK